MIYPWEAFVPRTHIDSAHDDWQSARLATESIGVIYVVPESRDDPPDPVLVLCYLERLETLDCFCWFPRYKKFVIYSALKSLLEGPMYGEQERDE